MNPIQRPRITWPSVILAGLFCASAAAADPMLSRISLGLSGGLESFHLKELSSNGTRLLAESGNRLVVTAYLDDRKRYELANPWFYHLEGAIYSGQVDYDGQSQSVDPAKGNIPFKSQTDYQGGRGEALVGYRTKASIASHPLEILGGMGIEGWSRSIKDGTTSGGIPVSGIEEIYHTSYGKLALGIRDLFSTQWHTHLYAGFKLPFSTKEDINLRAVGYDSDLSINPGNHISTFIKFMMESRPTPARPAIS